VYCVCRKKPADLSQGITSCEKDGSPTFLDFDIVTASSPTEVKMTVTASDHEDDDDDDDVRRYQHHHQDVETASVDIGSATVHS